MRPAAILEIAIREVSTYCRLGELAYRRIDKSGRQAPEDSYLFIHALLGNCATVARLLWSQELAEFAGGQTVAQRLELPSAYHVEDDRIREILDRYDYRLARGLSTRGEVGRVLDFNIGDRDAFEEEMSVFLRHYDPTVDTLTLMEEEFPLGRIASELADIKTQADAWLDQNGILLSRPASPSIPPRA